MSDDWSIDNFSKDGAPGSRVLISFWNGYTYSRPDIEVDLHLVGELPLLGPGFPLKSDDPPIFIELFDFWFYVHAHGTEDCRILGKFNPRPITASR